MANASSAIIYSGPSMIDGAPIVAIATGMRRGSNNAKTGAMVQVFIIRQDMHPMDANRLGADVSICGDCPHRGTPDASKDGGTARNRTCYVRLDIGVASVFRAYRDGKYDAMPLDVFADAIRGMGLRLGAYGDPAAVPVEVWNAICPAAEYVNGYTHAWRRFPQLATWCMASADSAADRAAANAAGFRTFRVRAATEAVGAREVVCPASAEAGKRTVCALCKACGGKSARAKVDVAIIAHGAGARNFATAA